MKLRVYELVTQLTQKITTGSDAVNLLAVRPHLYKHLAPAGSLKVQLLDQNQKLIAESDTVTISSISSENYFHGYVRFYINASLLPARDYYLSLVGSGYTFSESAFIGWCDNFDLEKHGEGLQLDYEPWVLASHGRG